MPFAGPSMGFAFLPEVGAGVWIEFEGGDVSYPIWTGCYWHDGEQPSDATASVLAIVTKAGQKILLDDDGGTITVSDQNGNTVTLDSSGISLASGGQQRGAGRQRRQHQQRRAGGDLTCRHAHHRQRADVPARRHGAGDPVEHRACRSAARRR